MNFRNSTIEPTPSGGYQINQPYQNNYAQNQPRRFPLRSQFFAKIATIETLVRFTISTFSIVAILLVPGRSQGYYIFFSYLSFFFLNYRDPTFFTLIPIFYFFLPFGLLISGFAV